MYPLFSLVITKTHSLRFLILRLVVIVFEVFFNGSIVKYSTFALECMYIKIGYFHKLADLPICMEWANNK